MIHIDQSQFESLWQRIKDQPLMRQIAPKPIQADLSLANILTQYMAMAAGQREWGNLSQQDYNDLDAAVNALKSVLTRINDSELVAKAAAKNAALIQQKLAKPGL